MELTKLQINQLNKMNRVAYQVNLGDLLNNLIKETSKNKYFCTYCYTISEQTDSRGNCISCGSPFGKVE